MSRVYPTKRQTASKKMSGPVKGLSEAALDRAAYFLHYTNIGAAVPIGMVAPLETRRGSTTSPGRRHRPKTQGKNSATLSLLSSSLWRNALNRRIYIC